MLHKNVATLALAAVLSIGALPALADSASFSFSVGDHGGHRGGHYRGHHDSWRGHGYSHHSYYRSHYWGGPSIYYAPRPVVYYQRPTVIERPVFIESETINATRGRVVSNNPYCREYQRNVTVGGHIEQSYGTACRQPDGAWKIVSEND